MEMTIMTETHQEIRPLSFHTTYAFLSFLSIIIIDEAFTRVVTLW